MRDQLSKLRFFVLMLTLMIRHNLLDVRIVIKQLLGFEALKLCINPSLLYPAYHEKFFLLLEKIVRVILLALQFFFS